MNTNVADILELSVAERIQIVEEIWESIAADSSKLPLTDEMRAELDRRLEAYDKDPEAGIAWEELEKRLTTSR